MPNFVVKGEGDKFTVVVAEGFIPDGTVTTVPPNVPLEDVQFYKAEMQDVEGGSAWVAVLDPDKKAAGEARVSLGLTKQALKDQYIHDIDQQMLTVFGTTNREKASSLYLTWQLMAQSPLDFTDKGLVDDTGGPLDSYAKVQTYVNSKLAQAKDYSVFLMTRGMSYKDAVANL